LAGDVGFHSAAAAPVALLTKVASGLMRTAASSKSQSRKSAKSANEGSGAGKKSGTSHNSRQSKNSNSGGGSGGSGGGQPPNGNGGNGGRGSSFERSDDEENLRRLIEELQRLLAQIQDRQTTLEELPDLLAAIERRAQFYFNHIGLLPSLLGNGWAAVWDIRNDARAIVEMRQLVARINPEFSREEVENLRAEMDEAVNQYLANRSMGGRWTGYRNQVVGQLREIAEERIRRTVRSTMQRVEDHLLELTVRVEATAAQANHAAAQLRAAAQAQAGQQQQRDVPNDGDEDF
ncbi:MAG: hypothetical protein JKY15_07485, partial [Deltaproteobacteria bacterium]|nr:hypothetical protein [Deltaproteobacteria bacterium]